MIRGEDPLAKSKKKRQTGYYSSIGYLKVSSMRWIEPLLFLYEYVTIVLRTEL